MKAYIQHMQGHRR